MGARPVTRSISILAAGLLVAGATLSSSACGGDDDTEIPNLIRQDNASDEAWLSLKDAVDQGQTTVDDAQAAALTAPADTAEVPSSEPFTFEWALPVSTLRHGVEDGQFVWVEFTGGGLAAPLNVVSLTSRSWTPDADSWTTLTGATGTIEVRVYTAIMDHGLVDSGPYEPTADPISFTFVQ